MQGFEENLLVTQSETVQPHWSCPQLPDVLGFLVFEHDSCVGDCCCILTLVGFTWHVTAYITAVVQICPWKNLATRNRENLIYLKREIESCFCSLGSRPETWKSQYILIYLKLGGAWSWLHSWWYIPKIPFWYPQSFGPSTTRFVYDKGVASLQRHLDHTAPRLQVLIWWTLFRDFNLFYLTLIWAERQSSHLLNSGSLFPEEHVAHGRTRYC